MVKMLL